LKVETQFRTVSKRGFVRLTMGTIEREEKVGRYWYTNTGYNYSILVQTQ
jgi:hypothetical protein